MSYAQPAEPKEDYFNSIYFTLADTEENKNSPFTPTKRPPDRVDLV